MTGAWCGGQRDDGQRGDGLRAGLPAVGEPVVVSWPAEAGILLPSDR